MEYNRTQVDAQVEITKIGDTFLLILYVVSLVLMGVIIYLSYFLSNHLTRDLTVLNQRMFSFINSGFKEENEETGTEKFTPATKEIYSLNRDFVLLKTSLKSTLDRLENSFNEAKQASEYKSTFLANMSHENSNSLKWGNRYGSFVKRTKSAPTETDYLNTIEFSAGHLLELINMTLDYSKIEAGKMELDQIAFDLKGDLIKLTKIFEYKIQEKGLEMKLDIQTATDHYFIGDPMRIQQILINLLNNAIKFTDKGIVFLSIHELEGPDQKSKRLMFEIEDSGMGISEEKAERLFEAFNQADTSISRNFGGTGLGLTISNELVKLMGGELRYTKLAQGSKFSFELLFNMGEKILHHNKKDSFDPMKYNQPKILLVEDNPINQKVICLMLSRNNALVDLAENGLEAVELFAQNEYDLILMDIRMPKMDGLEATRIIRATERFKTLNTPIVAVTANAFHEDRIRALVVGMDDFISKPVKPIELEAILAKYLKKQVPSA